MANPERKIFVPAGDTARGNLGEIALREAFELVEGIDTEEEAKGKHFDAEIKGLSPSPQVNVILLREGITATSGVMVNIEEKDTDSREMSYALDEFVNLALKSIEEAEAKKEKILSKVPEGKRKYLENLMGFTCFLISEINKGNYSRSND